MVRNLSPLLLVVVVLLFLSGCTTLYNPATERNEIIFINSATEVAIGQKVVSQLISKHPLWQDPVAQARVHSVGARLAQVSDRKDIEYKFSILEDKELNAVALPGGFIYINRGLLEVINDDQLAYVLGHEVGHVAARHIAKKLQTNMTYQLLLGVAFAGLGSDAGSNAQAIAQGVDTAYGLIELNYSRKDEYEADRLAAKYAYRAGFDPYGSIAALEVIKKQEGPNWKVMGYFRTHPYADDRIKALKDYIPKLGSSGVGR